MYRLGSVILSALLLAGCATVNSKPATVAGECSIFHDPGFPVRGSRDKDQRWVTRTQETGISVCGWARPKPEAEVPTVAETAAPPPPPKKQSRFRGWLGI